MITSGAGTPHANKWSQRSYNTISGRDNIKRRWKADNTPLKEGQRLYYNFIRENHRLMQMTPAEIAGLFQAGSQNRWKGLLKKELVSNNQQA